MRESLHIALCTDGVFPQAMGGMQRHSRLLAEHLVRIDGVRLTVLHPHDHGIFNPALGIAEVPLRGIDPGRFYIGELWRYSGRVAKALDRVGPDVILSQGFSVWQGIDRFSERLIVHPHGLEMFQGLTFKDRMIGWPFRAMLRYVARRSSGVVSLGGGLTPVLERLVKGSAAKVVVVPNAVDVPAVPAAYPPLNGPLRILFVGRFAYNKGIDMLMDVAYRLCEEGMGGAVRFELAGDGPLLAHYQTQGLPANVALLGRVDDEALFKLYAECHALILPTRFEGMPTVVLEAMARARPVLVTDVGATAELVDHTNGRLLPKGNTDALYTAVHWLLELSDEERRALGTASYRRAAEGFAWPTVTRAMLAVCRAVGGRSPSMKVTGSGSSGT